MYLLCLLVVCMVRLTVTLPVLQEPPDLPYSKAYAYQDGEIHRYIPKADIAPPQIETNHKEVEDDIVKFYPVSIPPPPELPPFDYSILRKLYAQRARSENSIESDFERFFELKDMKPIDKPNEVIEEESQPIENFKFEEKVQPMEEYKSIEESKSEEAPVYIMEPTYIEVHKSAEQPKSAEEPMPVKEPKSVEELLPIEQPLYDDDPKLTEESKPLEEPTPFKEPKSTEEPTVVEEIVPLEELLYLDKLKPVEEPKLLEEPKPAEEPKPVEEPNPEKEPNSVEHIDSTKVETKEEPEKPLEDIPVVIQFSIPTTSFLSSIISKFPFLSSFSWPFHIPSIFSRPRFSYPVYTIDDEIIPY